jgi:hypothetical protein
VSATTQENNRTVVINWSVVANASGYRIERTTRVGDPTSWYTTVGSAATSYTDVVPASSAPVTYIYYVRTIDDGELSERGPWDHATTATALYAQVQLGGAIVKGSDIGEIRGAIDALRYALQMSPQFGGSVPATGLITAAHFNALASALNAATGFAYSGVAAPQPGGPILATHIQQLREALR